MNGKFGMLIALLILWHQTLQAQDIVDVLCEKQSVQEINQKARTQVREFAIKLSNANLEFTYPMIKRLLEKQEREEICLRLGDWIHGTRHQLWSWNGEFVQHLCSSSPAVLDIEKRVSDFVAQIENEYDQLSGYCKKNSYIDNEFRGRNNVLYRDDKEFMSRFENTTTHFIEFQQWAWYDFQGTSRIRSVEEQKKLWMQK